MNHLPKWKVQKKTKTQMMREFAKSQGLSVHEIKLSEITPEDLKGMPVLNKAARVLSPEECRVYEQFSVEQAQKMAQGRLAGSYPKQKGKHFVFFDEITPSIEVLEAARKIADDTILPPGFKSRTSTIIDDFLKK